MSTQLTNSGVEKIRAREENGCLTPTDISELLNTDRSYVYQLIKKHKIRMDSASYLSHARKRIEIGEFERFLIHNPKYYKVVCGTEYDPSKMEVEEKKVVPVDPENEHVVDGLLSKIESIEEMIEKLTKQKTEIDGTINELETKKLYLMEVLEMF